VILDHKKEAKFMQQETDVIEERLGRKLEEIKKEHEEKLLIMKTYE